MFQKNYTILKEDDIRQRQEHDITRICSVLSVSRDYACMLFRPYNWNVSNVHEASFANEDKVRKVVGLLDKTYTKLPKGGELPCRICFESYSLDKIITTACGYPFCNKCWTAYISTSINDGPGCLTLRCPWCCCRLDMVNKLTSDEDKTKYRRYLLRSYIEDNRKVYI
ncbi:putative transcription factor C2H2 family [Helianthus annuus]|nr:putative transcription factor C2H2 family [Helianthus annuus]KAJ0747187.1 putative transcription factor C2H2 family [Helianthus annuus]